MKLRKLLLLLLVMLLTACSSFVPQSRLPRPAKQPTNETMPTVPLKHSTAYAQQTPMTNNLSNVAPTKYALGVPQNMRAFSSLNNTWGGHCMLSTLVKSPKGVYHSYDLYGTFVAKPAYIKGKIIEDHANSEPQLGQYRKQYQAIITGQSPLTKVRGL